MLIQPGFQGSPCGPEAASFFCAGAKKNRLLSQSVLLKTGNVLLSQAAARQVSSAQGSLTAVFGMGTGVSSPLLSPDFFIFFCFLRIPSNLNNVYLSHTLLETTGQVLDLLVSVS